MLQRFEGDEVTFTIDNRLRDKIRQIEIENGATLFMVLLAAFNILLMKYSGQEDIIIGSPEAGRHHADLHRVVGMFVNLLVLRNRPEAGKTFKDFLREVKENCIEAFENQDVQFDELVDRLNTQPDPSRNPLFDVCLFLQNFMEKAGKIKEKKSSQNYLNSVTQFDMELGAYEMTDGIYFCLGYSTALFKRSAVESFAKRYVEILEQLADNTDMDVRLKNITLTHKLAALRSNILANEEGDFKI
jgi:non-ribosomal peptide synthetase component F